MREVTVKVEDLKKIVRENREKHRDVFERAMEGYRKQVIEELDRRIAEVEDGRKISHRISLPVPEDHTEDYDRALKMLEMTVDDEVTLDEQHFAQLVMDDWGWKGQFTKTASNYTHT